MVPFSLFLALKYLKPKRSFMSVISVISVIGVMLGVAVLIIVLSVMNGFDDMWRDKILGFDAHITITRQGNGIDDYARLAEKIAKVPDVVGVAPSVQGLVFVQHRNQVYTPLIRGIDVDREKKISRLPSHMIQGRFCLDDNEALIGRDLAFRLGVTVGDKILVYSPQTFLVARDEINLPMELTIAGVFEVGMWEYDIGFVLVPLMTAQELYGMDASVHSLRVMTRDPFQVRRPVREIERLVRAEYPDMLVRTWMELNRQLFDALRVEKNLMFFLLIFIVLVAAFGITNSLIIVTVQKTKEIGLLKALGFSAGSVMRVFIWQGLIQGVFGTILGIGMGLGMLRYRNGIMRGMASAFNMELFPKELYHLSEIPSRISSMDIVLIAVLSLGICTLAGVLPAWRAARLEAARALRYE